MAQPTGEYKRPFWAYSESGYPVPSFTAEFVSGPGGGFGRGLGAPGALPDGMAPFFGFGSLLASPMLQAADANKDGKLTKVESASAAKRWFSEWDNHIDSDSGHHWWGMRFCMDGLHGVHDTCIQY